MWKNWKVFVTVILSFRTGGVCITIIFWEKIAVQGSGVCAERFIDLYFKFPKCQPCKRWLFEKGKKLQVWSVVDFAC